LRTSAALLTALVVPLALGACGGSSQQATGSSTNSTIPRAATSTSASTSTTVASASPVPPGAAALVVDGRKIIAIDAEGHRLRTVVTVFAGQDVMEVQLARDHNSIWYLERGGPNVCGTLVHLDLVTDKRDVVATGDSFAVSPDEHWLATADWVDGNDACHGSSGPAKTRVNVRDLASGRTSRWVSDPNDTSILASFIYARRSVWSPDGTHIAVLTCATGCTTRVWTVPTAIGSPITEAHLSARPMTHPAGLTEQQDIAWTADGLFVIDDSGRCCMEFERGVTNAIDRYDTKTLTLGSTLIESKNDYLFKHLAPLSTGGWLVVTDRLLRNADGTYRFSSQRAQLFNLSESETIAPVAVPDYSGPLFPVS
jgi:hypothetical protein